MFIIILVSIIKHKRSIHSKGKKSDERNFKTYKENFIIALSLSVVFGLGWGFGLLATSFPEMGVTITLQVLFSIFVGAQGALLFILYGIRNGDARDLWKQCWFRLDRRRRILSFMTTSKSTAKSPNEMSLSHSTGMNTIPHTQPRKVDLSKQNTYDIQKRGDSEANDSIGEEKIDLTENMSYGQVRFTEQAINQNVEVGTSQHDYETVQCTHGE